MQQAMLIAAGPASMSDYIEALIGCALMQTTSKGAPVD